MTARILVVDDSPTITSTVEWLLAQNGYETQIAHDGLMTLSLIRSFQPDVVLLDIRLPHIDGFQLCEAIRRKPEYAGLPVLMLSGLRSTADIERASEAGATGYLVKPVQDNKLLAAIEAQLALSPVLA